MARKLTSQSEVQRLAYRKGATRCWQEQRLLRKPRDFRAGDVRARYSGVVVHLVEHRIEAWVSAKLFAVSSPVLHCELTVCNRKHHALFFVDDVPKGHR